MKIIKISFFISFFFIVSPSAYSLELIAHRGISGDFEENTINAIINSWSLDADAVEIDIRISKDNILYLYHDQKLQGINVQTLAYKEINELNNSICKLSEVLKINIPDGYYILDLKDISNNDSFLNALKIVFANSEYPINKIAFQSSNIEFLHELKNLFPQSKFIFLSKNKRKFPWYTKPSNKELISKLIDKNISIVNIKGRRFIDKQYLADFKESGIKVFVWTINDFDRIDFYKDIGADGIITDKIDELKR